MKVAVELRIYMYFEGSHLFHWQFICLCILPLKYGKINNSVKFFLNIYLIIHYVKISYNSSCLFCNDLKKDQSKNIKLNQ